jgi:hypothetical protein
MGDLAQRRARPWLVGASLALLSVVLTMGGLVAWYVRAEEPASVALGFGPLFETIMVFDAVIAGEIAVAVVLMGQAIGSYELFTGRVLPRRGLLRHWHRTIVLALGYGGAVAAALAVGIQPIYQALLAMFIITLFHALVSWRLFSTAAWSLSA